MSQIAIPVDSVDKGLVKKSLRWNPVNIGRFVIFFGPLSSFFELTTFAIVWWIFKANFEAKQSLFQSCWFIVGLLSQTLTVNVIPTPKLPLIENCATDHHDVTRHGYLHLGADEITGRILKPAGLATELLSVTNRHPDWQPSTDDSHDAVLHLQV